MEDREVKNTESRPGLGSVVVDRRGFGRFLKVAAAAALGLGMPASNAEPRRETPQSKPPEPPTPTRGATITEAPSRIPVVPPTTRAAEVVKQTPIVVVEAQQTVTPAPTEAPAVVTAAPQPTPRPTPAETTTPRPPEPPKPTELLPLLVPSFDVDNKFMLDLRYGAGGGAVDLRSPTADTGGTTAELPGDPREYASRMFGIADRDFFVKDPVGRMLYGMSVAVQAGLPEQGPTTYRPFDPEELRYWTSKLNAPHGAQVEMMTINGETTVKTIENGADIGVAGTIEVGGKRWFVIFYDNYKEADAEGTPKGYIGIVPQEAFEKLAPLAGIKYDKAVDGTLTFKFEDSTGRRRTWVPNDLEEDYRDSILKWMQEREIPSAPETVEWPIERIKEEQARTGKILGFWAEFGGRAEEATGWHGKTVLLVTGIPKDTEVPLPITARIDSIRVGQTTGRRSVYFTPVAEKTFGIFLTPDSSVLVAQLVGKTADVGTPMARITDTLVDMNVFNSSTSQGQILISAYNPKTNEVLPVTLSDVLTDDEDRVVVMAR